MHLNAVTYMQSGIKKKKTNPQTNSREIGQRNMTKSIIVTTLVDVTLHWKIQEECLITSFFLAKRFLSLLNSVFGSFEVVSSSHAEPCRGWMCILSFWPLNLLKPYICLMFLKSQQKAYETQQLKA